MSRSFEVQVQGGPAGPRRSRSKSRSREVQLDLPSADKMDVLIEEH